MTAAKDLETGNIYYEDYIRILVKALEVGGWFCYHRHEGCETAAASRAQMCQAYGLMRWCIEKQLEGLS
jgi:hypothetical protein